MILPAAMAKEITINSEKSLNEIILELNTTIDLLARNGHYSLDIFYYKVTPNTWSGLKTYDSTTTFITMIEYFKQLLTNAGYVIKITDSDNKSRKSISVNISWA